MAPNVHTPYEVRNTKTSLEASSATSFLRITLATGQKIQLSRNQNDHFLQQSKLELKK